MKFLIGWFLGLSLLLGQELVVRRDALVFKPTYHPPLDTLTMADFWKNTAIHSEDMYNGEGSWGFGYLDWPTQPYDSDHPLVRVVARHVLGLLTLMENGLSDTTMVARAKISLNWLLQRQTPEGAWPLYTTPQGEISARSGLPTALAARTLSRGYRVLRNPRYLTAASQALEWQAVKPVSDANYERGLWIACFIEHYRTVREQALMDRAVAAGRRLLDRQLPNGSWNSPQPLTTAEHAELTAGLLHLEQALVEMHPFRRRLRGGVNAALNFLLENQLDNGNFVSGGMEPAGQKVPTLEIIAFIRAGAVRQKVEFDMPVAGAVRAMNVHPSNLAGHWRGTQDRRFLAMAEALVWFTGLQKSRPETMDIPDIPESNKGGNDFLPGRP